MEEFKDVADNEKRSDEREKNAKWYVVHTYSGHEYKVKDSIEKLVQNRGNEVDIFEVFIPIVKEETDKGKVIEKQQFPGYVLVKMINSDISWYLVRNTRGVTGFVGSGNKPVPLSKKEVEVLLASKNLEEDGIYKVDDQIEIINGAFKNFSARVTEVFPDKLKLKAFVSLFGRETLAELDYADVKKIK